MNMQENLTRERQQTAFVILCSSAVSLLLQIFKFNIFPAKYFYDANVVQRLMASTPAVNFRDSYANTAVVFQWMNQWLPMDSQLYGGLVLWALFVLPTGWVMMRHVRPTWEHYILIAVYAVILPVFVWNVQKEAIQYIFFLILLSVASLRKAETNAVDAMLVILLLMWSILFRNYYVLIAAGTAFLLIVEKMPWQKWSRATRYRMMIVLALAVFVCLLLMYILWPDKVHQLFNGRMGVNAYRGADPDANTIILDLVQNKNRRLSLYLLNYVLAAVRMMLPLELLFHGIKYIPFVIAQLFWTFLLLSAVGKLLRGQWNRALQKRLLSMTISWYLVAFLFEPDFGSFVRHQAAAFPLIYPVFTYSLGGVL